VEFYGEEFDEEMRGRRDKLTRNHKRKLISDKHVQ
jgi:hypothetical protein